jgi:hypothetical protein
MAMTTHAGPTGSAAIPREMPYGFLFRWLHWLLVPSTLVLILTGYSLHAGARPDWSLLGGKVPSWFWTGRVNYWHAWAAVFFTPAVLTAGVLYLRRRVLLRLTTVILLVGGALMVLSGFFLANPPRSALLYSASLWVHAVVGMAIMPIWFLWHLITGFTRHIGLLVPSFHPWAAPRWRPCVGFLVFAMITSWILLNGWPARFPWRDLVANRIPKAEKEIEDLSELPWEQAKPLEIQLANGNAFHAGRTRVTLRALHDGDELFVRAEWADPTENYEYWPWKKTETGWQLMQTSEKDECRCYEDKFTLFFPIEPRGDFERFGCAASCHLDARYGWGYKGSRYLLDTWHWKAARTGPAGQADDQYCAEVDFSQKKIGRRDDPGKEGYVENRKAGVDHPLFLPLTPDAVSHGSIPKSHAVPYSEEAAAALPVGTIIPGVVVAPFQGDRGDVRCQSRYRDGYWTLYLRRKLQTGSQYDTQFSPGGRYAFGCGAFDHAGKRHAYALPVYHLILAD